MTDAEKYIVLIMNWMGTGGHWIKAFASLDAARSAVREKVSEHNEIANRVVIIKGLIEQIGAEENAAHDQV